MGSIQNATQPSAANKKSEDMPGAIRATYMCASSGVNVTNIYVLVMLLLEVRSSKG